MTYSEFPKEIEPTDRNLGRLTVWIKEYIEKNHLTITLHMASKI